MNKILCSLLALTTVGIFACSAQKKTTTKKSKSKTVAKVLPAKPVNPTKMKSVLMGRSACFGHCPVYDIEIFENGLIRYTGKAFVPDLGTFEKMTAPGDAINVFREFDGYQPDTCNYRYESRIADLPGIHYFISYQDSVKHIINAQDGPEFLREMAKVFDRYGKVDKTWKQTAQHKDPY